MKIYSQTLTVDDLNEAVCHVDAPVYVRPGARVVEGRRRRIEGVRLGAESAARPADWREGQFVPPTYGGASSLGARRLMPQHATYDEHGQFMARLLDADPSAEIVSAINRFHGRDDFHEQTDNRYRTDVVA